MFSKIRIFFVKSWLAGMVIRFPVSLGICILGISLWVKSCDNLTPYSISVSGYYRNDGSYVSGYHRRPAGGVAHDEPYRILIVFSFFMTAAALIAGATAVVNMRKRPFDLLPSGQNEFPHPLKPILRTVIVPVSTAVARQIWMCFKCRKVFHEKQTYFYYKMGWDRCRFCLGCKELIIKERAIYDETMNNYKQSVSLIDDKRQQWRKELAQHYYGKDFSDW